MSHNPAPPDPTLVGLAAQEAVWTEDVERGRNGGAPTFKPLTEAQSALQAAQAQPKISRYDGDDLRQAKAALATAQADWKTIAAQKKRPADKLAAIASRAHRAQRLAEIARYSAQREINLDRFAAVKQKIQAARRQANAASSAALGAGNDLIGKKVIPNRLGSLAFETGTAKLTPASHSIIKQLAALLEQHTQYGIAIFGFTDNSAPDEATLRAFMRANKGLAQQAKTHADKVKAYNLALSSARARDVAILLVRRGIDPHRIGARGFGEQHPVASNATASGRRANRRVEAVIVPAPKNNGGNDANS